MDSLEYRPKETLYVVEIDNNSQSQKYKCLLCDRFLSSKQRVLSHLHTAHHRSPLKRVKKRYLSDPSLSIPRRTLYRKEAQKKKSAEQETDENSPDEEEKEHTKALDDAAVLTPELVQDHDCSSLSDSQIEEELIPNENDTKHVMISYQWDVQRLVIQLKNKLQAEGYKVWMDIDEMGGSTLESMATAVENASVVLVCVSQKYKESPNCRSEAEYTYQLHKDVIPLMMDSKYRPDGWLGFVVGSKFWIDFSEKHRLDSNADKLVKELGNRGKTAVQETTVKAEVVDVVHTSPQPSIRSWTNSDVKSWLKDVGLEGRLNRKAVERLNGRMLLRLQDLRKESPEFFYSSIRTDFQLENVFDVLEFVDELDKLQG